MPLIVKQLFDPQLIHHFGCSKIAAYSEAAEEFTLEIAKWLFLYVEPLAQLFVLSLFLTHHSPLTSLRLGKDRRFHRLMKFRCCLSILDGNIFHVDYFFYQSFPLHFYIAYVHQRVRASTA